MKTNFSMPVTEIRTKPPPKRQDFPVKASEFWKYQGGGDGVGTLSRDGYAFEQLNNNGDIERFVIIHRTSLNNYRCTCLSGNNLDFFLASNYFQIHNWLKSLGVKYVSGWPYEE